MHRKPFVIRIWLVSVVLIVSLIGTPAFAQGVVTDTPTATVTETSAPSSTATVTVTSTVAPSTATVTVTSTVALTATATTTATSPAAATGTATPTTPVALTATATTTPVITASATRTVTLTPALPSGTRTHIVRPGETLFCIGRAYRVWPFAIAEVNGIWWPYIIYPNQKLTIPATVWSPIPAGPTCAAQFDPSAVTATPTITPTRIVVTCRATYFVRPGDTLYRIALRYGTTYTEIARVNQIPNVRLIYVGQKLCIP